MRSENTCFLYELASVPFVLHFPPFTSRTKTSRWSRLKAASILLWSIPHFPAYLCRRKEKRDLANPFQGTPRTDNRAERIFGPPQGCTGNLPHESQNIIWERCVHEQRSRSVFAGTKK